MRPRRSEYWSVPVGFTSRDQPLWGKYKNATLPPPHRLTALTEARIRVEFTRTGRSSLAHGQPTRAVKSAEQTILFE